MSKMPSYGPRPTTHFFVYYEDDTDVLAVHWRGDEWGTEHHADRRAWYHDPLSAEGYRFLLSFYGLPEEDFPIEEIRKMPPEELAAAKRAKPPVPYVLIPKSAAERDAEPIGGESENKLGKLNNNGRKHVATSVMLGFGEKLITDPVWTVPYVFPTGDGGLEVATFTEFSGQDRHKHEKGTEIYTVLKGTMSIYLDDRGPYQLQAGDEVVVPPGTVHEVVQGKRRAREKGEEFDMLARVHSITCYGADDKYVQLVPDGPWERWSALTREQRASAYKSQG